MNLKPIKVKITITGDDFEFSFKEDYTEYAEDLIECENIFRNTGEPMTSENIYDYFKEATFNDYKEIEKLNGSYFLYGFLESLGQSDRCPELLYSYSGELKYKVEKI